MKTFNLLIRLFLFLTISVKTFNLTGPTVITVATENADPNRWIDAKILAPYASISASSSFDVATYISSTKINRFNLGYVTGDSLGNPKWNGEDPLLTDSYVNFIKKARSYGGDVIVSFGGSRGIF